MFTIPANFSFRVKANRNWEIICLIIFTINLILNANLAFYEKGKLVKQRKLILKNYLKGNFLIDSTGIFIFLMNIPSLKLLFLLKIVHL